MTAAPYSFSPVAPVKTKVENKGRGWRDPTGQLSIVAPSGRQNIATCCGNGQPGRSSHGYRNSTPKAQQHQQESYPTGNHYIALYYFRLFRNMAAIYSVSKHRLQYRYRYFLDGLQSTGTETLGR